MDEIEERVYKFLKSKGFDVYMEEPLKKVNEYNLIEKTGSGHIEARLYSATIAIQSYSTSLYKAMQLNKKVKSAMSEIPEASLGITHAELNSDYNFTDTETKRYRYQAVFYLVYFGG